MKIRCWYKVFGATEASLTPATLVKSLRPAVKNLAWEAQPCDECWTMLDLKLPEARFPLVHLSRIVVRADNYEEEITKITHGLTRFYAENPSDERHLEMVLDQGQRALWAI